MAASLTRISPEISLGNSVSRRAARVSDSRAEALAQSTESILDSLPDRTLVSFNGVTVPSNYVQQPATTIIRWQDALLSSGLTGAGTVAVIDTGVDADHPDLANNVIAGADLASGSYTVRLETSAGARLSEKLTIQK